MRHVVMFLLAPVLLCGALLVGAQQASSALADWPTYNHDLAGARYSPLAQINTGNVSTLMQAWVYRTPQEGPPSPFGGSEAVPIVVNGVMYLPSGSRIVALEADTGKEIWKYQVAGGGTTRRGVAYWPGDGADPPRILFTAGARLIGLNAATGDL